MGRRFLILILFALGVTISLPNGYSKSDIQYRVESLLIGISDLGQVKQVFGEPVSQKKNAEFYEGWREGELEGFYLQKTLNLGWLKEDIQKGELTIGNKRTVYDLEYPKYGIAVTMLDNPWRVNAISITNKDVEVNGMRVGDKLKEVEKRLGEGEWFTTDVEDGWWAEYEDKGVRYFFKADGKSPKYPMKLAKEKVVVKIEKYDSKVSFS
jgi:hypothetical protein